MKEFFTKKQKVGMDMDASDVFNFILEIFSKEGICSTSLKEIADETGKTINHVKKCLSWLRDKQYISFEIRRRSRPNGRDITDPIIIGLIGQ